MRLAFLFIWLFVLLPLPAFGAGESYPTTLVDQGCTDDYDTPAAQGTTNRIIEPAKQTSGSGDDRCDHDSRILTDEIDADTTFGPFPGGKGACWYVFTDANTVTGGDTKWLLQILARQPHDSVLEALDDLSEVTGAADDIWSIGIPYNRLTPKDQDDSQMALPRPWYLLLNLNTATSWTGEISMVGCE